VRIIVEGEKCVDAFNHDYKKYQLQTGTTFQWTATTAGAAGLTQIYRFALDNVTLFPAFYKNNKPKPLIIISDDDKHGISSAECIRTIFEPLGFLGKVYTLYTGGTGKDYADFSDENADPISRLIELGILTLNNN
jgi:hypothetical protein